MPRHAMIDSELADEFRLIQELELFASKISRFAGWTDLVGAVRANYFYSEALDACFESAISDEQRTAFWLYRFLWLSWQDEPDTSDDIKEIIKNFRNWQQKEIFAQAEDIDFTSLAEQFREFPKSAEEFEALKGELSADILLQGS
jgi:hypothetical protein